MKKTQYLTLITILLTSILYGQSNISKLPEKTPPSPEAFALTKYGDLPINESTGMFIYNIPIYTYTAGNLSLPISLNYAGSGVKVNDISTWTGINWNLNAGGVITRTVHHKPDELVSQRIFSEDITSLNLSDAEDDAAILASYFNTGNQYDTEPDIFSFSFLNYSGSFFLDKNYTPILMKGEMDYKIEIEGTQSSKKEKLAQNKHFIITTPDGIKYFFGLNDTQETKKMVMDETHQELTPLATTSFYLFRIDHPLNGKIFLEYKNTIGYDIKDSDNFSLIQYNALTPNDNGFSQLESTSVGHSQSKIQINSGKFLSRIYSENTSLQVIFNSDETVNGNFNFKNIINFVIHINN